MHKSTKLPPNMRREVYRKWCSGRFSARRLGQEYHVDKNVILDLLLRGRLGDFSVHDSTNKRYRTIEYGLRRLSKTEGRLEKRACRNAIQRYERKVPGELVHGDSKTLSNIALVPTRHGQRIMGVRKREVLFVSIDDASRFLVADILPDKSGWSGALFLEQTILRLPFPIEKYYSDNGGEFRGNLTHPFVASCLRKGIQQGFTKPRHPWTNGKAERVIKTLVYEWLRKQKFSSYEDRRQSLYRFVDFYNHERTHQGIEGKTPTQQMKALLSASSGDNA